MTDTDARAMLKKYSTSVFYREGGIAMATRTPPPGPGELVAGMAANVQQAKLMLEKAQARVKQAEEDGVFDTDAIDTVSDRVKDQWVSTIDLLAGDKTRAVAELRHWREYYRWAVETTKDQIVEREPGEEG